MFYMVNLPLRIKIFVTKIQGLYGSNKLLHLSEKKVEIGRPVRI